MTIINIHTPIFIYVNVIATQQLIQSHNSSKGENKPYYDKHHIQHSSIIHTPSYNHIKLFS